MNADTTTGSKSELPGLNAPDLPFKLTGSQSKTAFSIRQNCETMIAGNGKLELKPAEERADGKFIPAHWICKNPQFINQTGFLTLTLGKYICGEHGAQTPNEAGRRDDCPLCGNKMKFQQVFDAATASKHFNNIARRLLKTVFIRAIVVTERHKNKAIHFHLVGILRGTPDIKTGFDFAAFDAAKAARAKGWKNHAAETRYKISASDELRGLWKMLRDTLPGYGFGRAELTPIKKTGEAIACYVSKYIEKNICNRLKEDKRKKLVRYIGDWKTVKKLDDGGAVTMIGRTVAPVASVAPHKLKPNDFAWASKRATAWRGKAKETAGLIGITSPETAKEALGARWAYYLSKTWQGRTQDDLSPFLIADWETKRLLTNDLAQISRMVSPGWLKRNELPMQPFLPADYFPGWPEIYAQPLAEHKPDFDAEFNEIFTTGWKRWQEVEKERLANIAENLALN